MVPIASVISTYLSCPEPTQAAVACRLLFSSSVTPLFTMSLGMQLKFGTHVSVQFVCTMLASMFTPMECSACFAGSEFKSVFGSIGSTIDGTIYKIVWLNPSTASNVVMGGQYSCWLIVTFVQWCIGFLLSICLIYVMECWSRATYILSLRRGKLVARRGCEFVSWTLHRDAVFVTCWIFAVASITIWILLKNAT